MSDECWKESRPIELYDRVYVKSQNKEGRVTFAELSFGKYGVSFPVKRKGVAPGARFYTTADDLTLLPKEN